MSGSTFGAALRVHTFGESHGVGLGCVIDGLPAGFLLDRGAVQAQLARRRPGQSALVTPRDEADDVEILGGVGADGRTLGTPLALLVRNRDAQPAAYAPFAQLLRPSHADFTQEAKHGIPAPSGGGRASARETVGRVAAGAVVEQILAARWGVDVVAWVEAAGGLTVPEGAVAEETVRRADVDAHPTRCPHAPSAAGIAALIGEAQAAGDSLGGVVRVVARGVPPGWGEPVFDKLDALLGQALLSIPACKGVEIGSGFAGAAQRGSAHNDVFVPGPDGPATRTNRSGGVQGGISNGMPVVARAAFKPPATIALPQETVDRSGVPAVLAARGRHDPCVVPRAVPIVEAMVALVLLDLALRQEARRGARIP